MSATLTEDQQDATALLATVRHQMTGREIDICEAVTTATGTKNPLNEETHTEHQAGFESNGQVFRSLKIQFYAQITNWKNSGVAA